MDFASLMSSQIAKAKGETSSSATTTKKYLKGSETEAQRRAAYEAEQRALEAEREAKAAAKRKREEEAADEAKAREEKRQRLAEESRKKREEREAEAERARRRRLGLPELAPQDEGEAESSDDDDLPDAELMTELRRRGEPAALFGETHKLRMARFRKLTEVLTDGPIPTTLRPVDEKDMKVPDQVPPKKDKAARKYLFRQLASYFTMVLREWDIALEQEKRDTLASKSAYNAMVQCRETMKPVRSLPSPSPPQKGLPTLLSARVTLYPSYCHYYYYYRILGLL